jgi:hypothetical protein
MGSKLVCSAVLLALTALLAGCGESPSNAVTPGGSPLPTPTPVGLETPSGNSIYLGAYVSYPNGQITGLENQIGRRLAIDMHYDNWVSLFPYFPENHDLTAGRLSIDSWNCGMSDADIVSGAADPLIITRAQALRTFGHPIFLRFMWDMNLPSTTAQIPRTQCYDPSTDNSDGTFSATEFVQAWQHIRLLFAQQGATNVIWIWSFSSAGTNPAPYYPGNSQVDWIGIDAYDTSAVGFAENLVNAYQFAAAYGKPLMVTETGASSLIQSSFFLNAASTLQTQFPLIKGYVYYDSTAGGGFDWSLNTAGIAAFTTFAQSPYMSAYATP